jgi:hypothetical protein
VEIGLRSFEALKPWYVKRLKEFKSCCCRYHIQLEELKDAWNLMHRGMLHQSYTCNCEVCKSHNEDTCKASKSILLGVTAMCTLVLCEKTEGQDFHNLSCIQSDCKNCSIYKLQFCPYELDHDSPYTVPWRRFENVVVGQNDEGGDRHVLQLEHKRTPATNLILYLKPKLVEFIIHNFESKW